MSDNTRPVSPQVGLGTVARHPVLPTVAATACLLLAMTMPLVSASATLNGVPFLATGFSGTWMFGAAGWLAVAVFAAAVAARTVRAALPYRRLLDMAALVVWAALAVWAVLQIVADPAASGPSGAALRQSISLSPGLGLLPFVLAGPLAWLGMRRAKRAAV